ncbi:MAG: hypothetical protein ABJB05_04030 [Parafilimonas sp.]
MTFTIIAISYVAVTSMILGIFRAMRDRNMPESEQAARDNKIDSPVYHYSESKSKRKLDKVRYA